MILSDRVKIWGILTKNDSDALGLAKRLNGKKGDLKIGAKCLCCYTWLPGVVKAFQERYSLADIPAGNVSDFRPISTRRDAV